MRVASRERSQGAAGLHPGEELHGDVRGVAGVHRQGAVENGARLRVPDLREPGRREVVARGLQHRDVQAVGAAEGDLAKLELHEASYRDLAIVSPPIISEQSLIV